MTEKDKLIERLIDRAYRDLLAAEDSEAKASALRRMGRLCGLRSPEQVARMERQRGLS